jgi:hypothetical protein
MINIDELLNDEDRVCVPKNLIQLVKDNLKVVPITIYKLTSKYSKYEYTQEQLDWTKDHINQLIDDILLANLDKVKHLDNRIYKFFKEDKVYWLVKADKLYQVNITSIFKNLELTCEKEYDYILTEAVYYYIDISLEESFNNNKDFLKFGGQYLNKFFETENQALNYIKEQNDGQTN